MKPYKLLLLMFGWISVMGIATSEDTQEMLDLFSAARCGDVTTLDRTLKDHPERVNGTFGRKTMLYEAAERGDANMIAVLLQHGADIEVRNWQANFSPLCIAINNGHKDAARLLLEKKANVEGAYHSGRTPLFLCTSREMIELLLKYKANVDATDVVRRTPLHWAVQRADVETVQVLLEHGADVNARDSMGWTPLNVASQATVPSAKGIIDGPYHPSKHEIEELRVKTGKIMELLLSDKADMEAKDIVQFTPLLRAAEAGNNDQVRFLIAHGAQVNAKDSSGCTPLCRALENRDTDTAKLLVEKGAEIDVFTAAGLGMTGKAASLLDANRDLLNAKGFLDRTLLHWAVDNGQIEVVKLLVARGADIEVRDVYGWTPLAVGVQRGRIDILRVLTASHANVKTKDRFGKSVLAAAIELQEKDIADLLRQNGATE